MRYFGLYLPDHRVKSNVNYWTQTVEDGNKVPEFAIEEITSSVQDGIPFEFLSPKRKKTLEITIVLHTPVHLRIALNEHTNPPSTNNSFPFQPPKRPAIPKCTFARVEFLSNAKDFSPSKAKRRLNRPGR
jgi:hypothetical protein